MNYPFALHGRTVRVHRFSVTYTESGVEQTEYFNTLEQAKAAAEETGGKTTALDSGPYEWLDGIEVADVPDTYAEGIKLYEMGAAAWLSQAQERKQAENNQALAEYLSSHPITWQDGKKYGVTQQDQQEISLNLAQYQLATQAGLPARLEWHAVHEQCREFTQEELSGLALAISEYVYPLVRKNQAYKTKIYGASTAAELEGLVFSYEEAV